MTAPSPDALLHLATLHILSSAGFPSTSRAASLTLSSIAAKYLRTVAQACTEQAALAGRSKPGTGDVVEVLEDMGMGVGELERWMVSRAEGEEGAFVGGLEELGEQLRQGVELPDILAEMSLVPNTKLPLDMEESEDEDMEDDDGSVQMEVDDEGVPAKVRLGNQHAYVRAPSPDFSWLPPLPGQSNPSLPTPSIDPDPQSTTNPLPTLSSATQPKLSLIEKYRTRQSYSTSSLAQSNFIDPPIHPSPKPASTPTSSFPALLATYKAIAGEPSVSLAQTPLRNQAADLLRRVIAPPDMYGVSDTFSGPLPAPAGLIISPSASDTLPLPTIQVNPQPTGILSRLVREMRSPYLPPSLKERLTTLRPPSALNDQNGQPIYYGDPVRGPDIAALNKARGKPGAGLENGEDPADQEAYYRYTWDAGPRGADKWGKGKLPSGRKVVQSGQGETAPRTSDKKPATGLKLRLDRSPTTAQPPTPGGTGNTMEWEGQYGGPSGGFAEGRDKRQPTINLRIPSQTNLTTLSNPSVSPGTNPDPPTTLRISTASLSPNPPNPDSEPQASLAPARTPRITLSPNPITGRPSASSSVSPGGFAGAISPASGPPTPGAGTTGPSTGGGGGIKLRLGIKRDT